MNFDKTEMFSKLRVLDQVDRKFIATVLEQQQVKVKQVDRNEQQQQEQQQKLLLVLFDQHAVHERIRLEEIYRGEKWKLWLRDKVHNSCSGGHEIESWRNSVSVSGLCFLSNLL